MALAVICRGQKRQIFRIAPFLRDSRLEFLTFLRLLSRANGRPWFSCVTINENQSRTNQLTGLNDPVACKEKSQWIPLSGTKYLRP